MEESVWAKLETKVRRLVFELLEPSINRVSEHKETLENLRRTDESLLRKIENLDILTDKLTKRLAVVDDFSRKILQFDATIHVQETTFAQDRESMRGELETFLKQLTNAEENISNLLGQSQSLRTDLINLNFETNNTKNLISNRIEEVREESLNHIYQLDSKHSELNNYAFSLDKKFNLFLQDFSVVDIIAKKAEHSAEDNMNQLKIIFKNFASFKKESKESIEKVRLMAMQFSQTLTESMRSFREKFRFETPVQTQLIISENLHTVLELKEKKKLAEFEKEKFAEWEVMMTTNTFDDKIRLARQRTQIVVDQPLPIPERLLPLQTFSNGNVSAMGNPTFNVPSDPPQSESPKNLKFKKPRRLIDSDSLKSQEKPLPEKIVKSREKSREKSETPAKAEEEVISLEEISHKSEVLNEDLGPEIEEVPDSPKSIPEKETSEAIIKTVEVSKPFDLNDIKKNSQAIMSMLGIYDITEELSLINDSIKSLQDDLSSQVKRLQSANSSTDEKVQMIVKKQYETGQRFEELKTIQQNHANRAEADKKASEEADSRIIEKIGKESLEIHTKFSELVKKFSVLERDTQGKVRVLEENFEKIVKTTEKSLNSQEKTLQIFYDDISKTNQVLNLQIQQAALECNSAVTQRKRDHHDNQAEFKKIQVIFENFTRKYEQVNKNIENFSKTVVLLTEFSKIVHALMQQDEIDRESIALFGVKDSKAALKGKAPVMIDKQCITCSGQPNFITNAFKLACLAYSPTCVLFKDVVYERAEMIEILRKIVEGVSDDTLSEFTLVLDGQKQGNSLKQGHFRINSRHSNLSFSQSLSATPDLPPLSFPKRLN
jgi:hypothetical protein